LYPGNARRKKQGAGRRYGTPFLAPDWQSGSGSLKRGGDRMATPGRTAP